MGDLQNLQSELGQSFAFPSAANLLASVLFGIIGYAAFRYGRKTKSKPPVYIGLLLMLYPFVVTQTWAMYAVGVALCAALYIFRQPS
jgi:surface polysaccharide O-acyltransferase-like enzyme